jgi:hypothetical protein
MIYYLGLGLQHYETGLMIQYITWDWSPSTVWVWTHEVLLPGTELLRQYVIGPMICYCMRSDSFTVWDQTNYVFPGTGLMRVIWDWTHESYLGLDS